MDQLDDAPSQSDGAREDFADVGLTRIDDASKDGPVFPVPGDSDQDSLVIQRSGGNFVGKSNTDDYLYRPSELQSVAVDHGALCCT